MGGHEVYELCHQLHVEYNCHTSTMKLSANVRSYRTGERLKTTHFLNGKKYEVGNYIIFEERLCSIVGFEFRTVDLLGKRKKRAQTDEWYASIKSSLNGEIFPPIRCSDLVISDPAPYSGLKLSPRVIFNFDDSKSDKYVRYVLHIILSNRWVYGIDLVQILTEERCAYPSYFNSETLTNAANILGILNTCFLNFDSFCNLLKAVI